MAKKTTKKATKKTAKQTANAVAKKSASKRVTTKTPAKPGKKAAGNKTVATKASVEGYLAALPPDRRADCEKLAAIMRSVVKEEPKMWGSSIVGFGSYHYVYDSGREGDMCLTGFSSRANAITAYVITGFDGEPELMAKLGKFKTGKSCLYIKSMADIDEKVLKELVKRSVRRVRELYPE